MVGLLQGLNLACVFTVRFGGYDSVLPPEITDIPSSVPFYVLTDTISTPEEKPPAPWQELVISPLPYEEPRKNARAFKILPPLDLWNSCRTSIYVDGNVDLIRSPLDLVEDLHPAFDLGLVLHPFCDVYNCEVEHLCQLFSAHCSLYREHANKYVEGGFNVYSQTYESSFIVRRHTPAVRNMMEMWLEETLATTRLRDQISLAPTLYTFNKMGASDSSSTSAFDKEADQRKLNRIAGGEPILVQLYKGHNHDFHKWRCHSHVLGKERSSITRSSYCYFYYVVKRYAPWIEKITLLSSKFRKVFDMNNPLTVMMLYCCFIILSLAVSPPSCFRLWCIALWGCQIPKSRKSNPWVATAKSLRFGINFALFGATPVLVFSEAKNAITIVWLAAMLGTAIHFASLFFGRLLRRIVTFFVQERKHSSEVTLDHAGRRSAYSQCDKHPTETPCHYQEPIQRAGLSFRGRIGNGYGSEQCQDGRREC